MGTITHTFVSAVADGGDASLVRPSDWNAIHTLTLTAADVGAANPALSNLASVAINTALVWPTGLGAISHITGPSDQSLKAVSTVPVQVATSTAGNAITITAAAATAGSSTAGAAAGGAVTITSGAAARLTSGNANGGAITLTTGAGIGTGVPGNVVITNGQLVLGAGTLAIPSIALSGTLSTGIFFNGTTSVYLTSASGYAGLLGSVFVMAGGTTSMALASNSAVFKYGNSQDAGIGWVAATVTEVNNGSQGGGGALSFNEMTAPSAPAANKARVYAQDNGSGKTQLMVLFPSGAAQQLAIEP